MKTLAVTILLFALCQLVICAVHTPFGKPNIISRAEWGAREPKKTSRIAINPPPLVIIHHSASDGCTSRTSCEARVRFIQNFHMNTRGWDDIGYNFLVGEDGNVYEGRGWGKTGAHAVNYNNKSIGICLIGNFVGRPPNAAALSAAQSLISYGVSTGRIQAGYKLVGHRQVGSTTCPGDSLFRLIKNWSHWSSSA